MTQNPINIVKFGHSMLIGAVKVRTAVLEIATPVLQSAADLSIAIVASGNYTITSCALARNDMVVGQCQRLSNSPQNPNLTR